MPLPVPALGLMLHYSYLWSGEHERGLEEGTKDRPCVVVGMSGEGGDVFVTVAPVTHRFPATAGHAIEIPLVTKERLGLDETRSWIVVTELNHFRWPGPDLRSIPTKPAGSFAYGFIPPGLFRQVKNAILAVSHHAATVVRQ